MKDLREFTDLSEGKIPSIEDSGGHRKSDATQKKMVARSAGQNQDNIEVLATMKVSTLRVEGLKSRLCLKFNAIAPNCGSHPSRIRLIYWYRENRISCDLLHSETTLIEDQTCKHIPTLATMSIRKQA